MSAKRSSANWRVSVDALIYEAVSHGTGTEHLTLTFKLRGEKVNLGSDRR